MLISNKCFAAKTLLVLCVCMALNVFNSEMDGLHRLRIHKKDFIVIFGEALREVYHKYFIRI